MSIEDTTSHSHEDVEASDRKGVQKSAMIPSSETQGIVPENPVKGPEPSSTAVPLVDKRLVEEDFLDDDDDDDDGDGEDDFIPKGPVRGGPTSGPKVDPKPATSQPSNIERPPKK